MALEALGLVLPVRMHRARDLRRYVRAWQNRAGDRASRRGGPGSGRFMAGRAGHAGLGV